MYRGLFILTLLLNAHLHADLVADGYAEIQKHHYTTARVLWAKGCEEKNADACYNLGMMYGYGDGIPQDRQVANDFYLKACNLGNDLACGDYAH